jgi:hypothetical protein
MNEKGCPQFHTQPKGQARGFPVIETSYAESLFGGMSSQADNQGLGWNNIDTCRRLFSKKVQEKYPKY